MRNILLYLSAIFLFTSCKTTYYTHRDTAITKSGVIASDVVVDLKVDFNKKIKATSKKRKNVDLAKTEAYYKAIDENNVDVMIDPIFEVTTGSKFLFWGGRSLVKIQGYGANYTNPRTKLDAIKELKSVDSVTIKRANILYEGRTLGAAKPTLVKTSLNSTTNSDYQKVVSTSSNQDETKKGGIAARFGASFNYFKYLYDTDTNHGGFLGLSFENSPKGKLGFRTELLLSFNEDSSHMNIPFLAKYAVTENLKFFAGPSFTYLMDDDEGSFGLDLGASYDLGKKIFLDVRFSKGLTDFGIDEETYYNSTLIGLGYRF